LTKIYIIRHAEAEGNLYRRLHGRYNSRITPRGELQVAALEKRFEGVHIDAVYSSSLTRTKQTARSISSPRGLPIYTSEALWEIDLGVWEDVACGKIEQETPELLTLYGARPFEWSVPGCETFEEVERRIVPAVKEIAARHDGQTIAIFTHGTALKTILRHAFELPWDKLGALPYSDNTAVSLLTYENGRLYVDFCNDNSHLSDEISTFARQSWWKNASGVDDLNLRYEPIDLERDAKYFISCYADTWKNAHGDLRYFDPALYLRLAREHQRKHPGAVCRVFLHDTPAGVLDLDTEAYEKDGAGSIALYYMEEPLRSRGFGPQLLGEATSIYRKLGRRALRLKVAQANEGARRFYEANGFRHIGEERVTSGILHIMEKDISFPPFEEEIKL